MKKNNEIVYRPPDFNDGLRIFELIKASPPLDLNSVYYYYILCRDFSDTCVIAETHHKIIGFISSYRKPHEPSCLFVWQVVVDSTMRGHHVASDMLDWLFSRPVCSEVRTLETTVTPSNDASRNLFKRFADHRQAQLETHDFLDTVQLGQNGHEAEILFRIELLR